MQGVVTEREELEEVFLSNKIKYEEKKQTVDSL